MKCNFVSRWCLHIFSVPEAVRQPTDPPPGTSLPTKRKRGRPPKVPDAYQLTNEDLANVLYPLHSPHETGGVARDYSQLCLWWWGDVAISGLLCTTTVRLKKVNGWLRPTLLSSGTKSCVSNGTEISVKLLKLLRSETLRHNWLLSPSLLSASTRIWSICKFMVKSTTPFLITTPILWPSTMFQHTLVRWGKKSCQAPHLHSWKVLDTCLY